MDSLKKELAQAQRQLSEEQAKYKRDTQSLADSKKHLSVELNTKYAEVQRLSNQLEEKGQALKKSEQQLANVRKFNFMAISILFDHYRTGAEKQFADHFQSARTSQEVGSELARAQIGWRVTGARTGKGRLCAADQAFGRAETEEVTWDIWWNLDQFLFIFLELCHPS